MVWSNWRKAISRGAILVLLCWSGLAWTQAPDSQTAPASCERIMVVHENGKSTRCRVVESWKLPDGRIAHLLQSLETGDMITIVDDQCPSKDQVSQLERNPRAMPKRIFLWGQKRRTPPEGSPIPPHLRIDSGLVLRNEEAPPPDALIVQGPDVANRVVDEHALGKSFGTLPDGVQRLDYTHEPPLAEKNPVMPAGATNNPSEANPVVTAIGQEDKNPATNPVIPAVANDANTLTFPVVPAGATNDPPAPAKSGPLTIVQTPDPSAAMPPLPSPPGVQLPTPSEPQPVLPPPSGAVTLPPVGPTVQIVQPNVQPTTMVSPPAPMLTPNVVTPPSAPAAPAATTEPSPPPNDKQPIIPVPKSAVGSNPYFAQPAPTPMVTPTPRGTAPAPIERGTTTEDAAKKPWHFGDRVRGLFAAKTPASTDKKDEPKKVEEKKSKAFEDFLPTENKVVEKKMEKKIETTYKAPFSTAMGASPTAVTPPAAKPDATPLVIPTAAPAPEKKAQASPALPDPPAAPKQADSTPPVPQREMWGTAKDNSVQSPGKFVLDSATKPSVPERANDPLMSPERFIPNSSKLASKYPTPDLGRPLEVKATVPAGEMNRPAPLPDEGKYPPGAQSVLAAKMGMPGPVIYVPVPTVTVPQPNQPPYPPEPKMPEGPQLNAFVNAFSAPPAPQTAPRGPAPILPPQQAMVYGPMTPQAMAPNPALAQQMYQQQQMAAQMYQQQMMQQQMAQQQPMLQQQPMMQQPMMQQQPMNPYGYQPYPAPANAFVPPPTPPASYGYPAPTQGPAMNFSRSYMGPAAPNPFAAHPEAQSGIAQVSYQQPVMTPQYAIAAQVEQTIRVLRESPYPAQREWAAQTLVSFDWRTNPQLVPVLLQAATQDPAPTVRAGAVYCLGRMKAGVEPVITTLQMLRKDADPRVRQEVEQAFLRLSQP